MNVTELTVDTLFLSNTVSTQYKSEPLINNLNRYYDEVVLEIWKWDATWKFDKGHDTLPIAETKLFKGRRDYQIPTDARRIKKVEVLDKKGNTVVLEPTTPERIKEDDREGTPKHYYLEGRSIYVYPKADQDIDDGLIIYMSRSVEPLEVGEDEPKIDSEFRRYLSIGAAMDWYFAKGDTRKSRELERKLERMKIAIKDFYSSRNQDYKSGFKVKLQNYK